MGVKQPGSPFRTQTKYVPTCDGNDATTDGGLCGGAVDTCPTLGDVRYWTFRRTINITDPAADPPFERVLDPPFVCLGPADPRLDPTVAIPAIVEQEFQRVVVLKGIAEVTPRPDTLVNIDTVFTTAAPASYDIPLTILGQSVVITATADSWTWFFGDGSSSRVEAKGTAGRTTHEYVTAAGRGAYVVIEWTGTYRIGGDPQVRAVTGTATTTGEPIQVLVRQARTELVDQPS